MKDQKFLDQYITLKRKIIDAEAALRAAQAEQKALADRWAEEQANAAGYQVGGVYQDVRGVGVTTDKPTPVQIMGATAGVTLTKGPEGESDTRGEWDYQAEVWVRYRYANKSGGWAANGYSLPLDKAKRIFQAQVEV